MYEKKILLIFVVIFLLASSSITTIAQTISNDNNSTELTKNDDFEYIDPEWSNLWTMENPPDSTYYCGYEIEADDRNNLIYVNGITYNSYDAEYTYLLQ